MITMHDARITQNIMMIRPVRFDLNEETLASNAFQSSVRNETPQQINTKAVAEFDAFVEKLQAAGVNVMVFQDTPKPFTPDSIFPNNWVSFHRNGMVITYPMHAPNRRAERRRDIIDGLEKEHGLKVNQFLDISKNYELNDQFLEGTGSMVLDGANKVVYACLSPRTDAEILENWCRLTDYEPVMFTAVDQKFQKIYHTNVLMCIGDGFVVIALDAIKDDKERQQVESKLKTTGHEVIPISLAQMNQFAGNMLQVCNDKGNKILVMSQTAYNSLIPQQIERLKLYNEYILTADIPTIENYGGGSVRCMMAEVYLSKKEAL